MMRVAVVIPTLNEEASIGGGGARDAARPRHRASSSPTAAARDATAARARAAGAEVIEAGRGYGRACHAGAVVAQRRRHSRVHGRRRRRRSREHRGARRADPRRHLRFRHRLAAARGASPAAWLAPARRRPARRARHAASLRRALHRHVRVSRDPPRRTARARHARDDLRLEHRDADARRPRRPAHSRDSGAVSPPQRRRLQGRRQPPRQLKAAVRIVATFIRVSTQQRTSPALAMRENS